MNWKFLCISNKNFENIIFILSSVLFTKTNINVYYQILKFEIYLNQQKHYCFKTFIFGI